DNYAYDEDGKKTQKEREEAAKQRIFSILPKDQMEELTSLFEEFEAGESAESRYARAMDNLQPLILNDSNDGSDWKEHGVKAEQVYARQGQTKEGSEKLYEVTDSIIKRHIEKGNLK
ncbi:MAG: HD domain-containing protein, partial [Lachnospiraceae bacterium]|nr:HD domain-containing protein [Lachnospiraceae bacterium]